MVGRTLVICRIIGAAINVNGTNETFLFAVVRDRELDRDPPHYSLDDKEGSKASRCGIRRRR